MSLILNNFIGIKLSLNIIIKEVKSNSTKNVNIKI